ncbi:hypothetical protein CAEBREN_26217 [Caenorhabditis brenneri]|uniref:F-box domain-containing protein n=1 Tax=Caenorhabditis brenneri TaxID=135651 RepID=G0NSK6_CAEBE|nr:hypothetical protein CAEBREN_26217 [Caenorhabditis brenneri]
MGVPILRLPYLALKVLVDHFNYVELVTVSLVSKRADWVLKTCGKKPVSFFYMQGSDIRDLCDFDKFALVLLESRRQGVPPDWNLKVCCVLIDENYFSIICNNYYTTSIVPIYFDIIENIEQFDGDRRSLKIGESSVPVVITKENDGRDKIRTFWSRGIDGMMEVMDYFMKTFNLPFEELKFASKDTGAIRTVCNHIHSNQIVVKTVQKLKLGTITSLWHVTEGFETREGICGKCHPYNTIVRIEGHGGSCCCVQTNPGEGFHFVMHDK